MSDMIYFNGKIMPFAEARVGIEDRGFQFADGVYEVIRFYFGRCFTLREHLERLWASADGLRISPPTPREELAGAIADFVTRSGLAHGMVYLQLTRGVAPRAHPFPQDASPTLLFYARPLPPVPDPENVPGVKLHSVADDRWLRCHIKSIALLPNVLAKQAAIEAGADEAVFLHQNVLTECSASNIFFVSQGRLITHPVGPKVLPGITRLVVRQLAQQLSIPWVEQPLSLNEALAAEEVFITSTTRELAWVSHWDGRGLATRPGPVTLRLHQAFQHIVQSRTRE